MENCAFHFFPGQATMAGVVSRTKPAMLQSAVDDAVYACLWIFSEVCDTLLSDLPTSACASQSRSTECQVK